MSLPEIQTPAELQRIDNAPLTPMDMLNTALSRGASIEVMEKLMGLQERWEANQARKAFDAAIAAAKAEIGPVVRNKKGHNDKRYADFSAIARAIDPVLSRHGLSYRFRTSQTDRINVTCILSHRDGHSEETTLGGPPDASGSKNAIQAIGSTLTYLQRYSLMQAVGVAASDDDDGKSHAAAPKITEAQVGQLNDLIEAVSADRAKFLRFLGVERLEDIFADKFDEVVAILKKKAQR